MTARPDARLNCFAWESENAAQLAEFAITLPLLVVFVVGIFDFSGAFTLKQKLTNIARDAARAAAADPATDLRSALPISVSDAFYVVDNYLLANNINDCGLGLQTPTLVTGHPLTWQVTISSSSGSPCGIILTINRGYYFPIATPVTTPPALTCTPAAANGAVQVVGTCVSIQYSYQWRFGKVVSLLGSSAMLPPNITAEAVAMNEN
ncbi:MAG: TadE/TadG family type IV pilus assembly protein [Candidatus Sulfotelmatobacter sp.]